MSMVFPTGEVRTAPCASCGTVVAQYEYVTSDRRGPFWNTNSHRSPCGLPCLHGGVPGDAYRQGQYHSFDARKATPACPVCTPDAPPRVFPDVRQDVL